MLLSKSFRKLDKTESSGLQESRDLQDLRECLECFILERQVQMNIVNINKIKNKLTLYVCAWYSIIIVYFTVGERVRFLFTSCVKRTSAQRVNKNRTSELTVK